MKRLFAKLKRAAHTLHSHLPQPITSWSKAPPPASGVSPEPEAERKSSPNPESTQQGPSPSTGSTERSPESTAQETSQTAKSAERNCDSKLESLPPEIRRCLLSALDLPRLKSLVHASPLFHEQYLYDRTHILRQSLWATLGSAVVDAYIVSQSGGTRHKVMELLRSHSDEPSGRAVVETLAQQDAESIVIFYSSQVKPVVDHYVQWSRDNVAMEAENTHQEKLQEGELTFTERTRFLRAIYRFQLLCQLRRPERGALGQEEEMQRFFNFFEPWETEEVFSFYQFAQAVYDKTITNITWDLHADNPRFDDQGRPPTPVGSIDFEEPPFREGYIDGTLLAGALPFLHTVLFKIKDHEHLLSTMEKHLIGASITINLADSIVDHATQLLRHLEDPTRRDKMQDERVPCLFRGDGDGPPQAWTIIWGDTYSSLYGIFIPNDLRRCGYVFWDATTLDKGAREVVERLWQKYWNGDDPRKQMRPQ